VNNPGKVTRVTMQGQAVRLLNSRNRMNIGMQE